MTPSSALFYLFLVLGGALWALYLRRRRGDPGKTFRKAREDKKQGVKPVVKRDLIGVPIVSDDGKLVLIDDANDKNASETADAPADAGGSDEE